MVPVFGVVWASRGSFGGCWGWGFGFRGALKPTAGLVAVGVGSRGVLWGWVSGFEPVGDIGCDGRGWAGGGGWLFAVWFFFVVVEVVGLA